MNKTFKDFIQEDLDVFFNVKEFAEEHLLDDEPLLCVVVESKRDDKYSRENRLQDISTSDLFVDRRTIYVKASDFFIPQIGAVLTLDGEEFDVIDAAEEDSVIRIELSRNES